MRRAYAVLATLASVLTCVLLVFGPASAARAASGERYLSWNAAYALQPDGSVRVTETLRYQFAGGSSHGLKRLLVTRQGYGPDPSKARRYALADVSATSPSGAPADVSVSDQGSSQEVIRIGDPARTVSGVQTYVLHYTLGHVVNAQQQGTVEFYWNSTGARNDVPIDHYTATVTGPAASSRAVCFLGVTSSDRTCPATAGATARFSADSLPANQQVTIATEMPGSAFTDTAPDLVDAGSSDSSWTGGAGMSPSTTRALHGIGIGAGVGLPLIAAGAMGAAFWKRGRDERYAGITPGLQPAPGQQAEVVRGGRPVVAVRFQPPEGVRPGLMGTVLDEEAGLVDLSATIVDLAVRGHLTLRQVDAGRTFGRSDWEIAAARVPGADDLLPYEQTIWEGLFQFGSPVRLSELRNHLKSWMTRAQGQMYTETVRRGWFRSSPEATRTRFQLLGTALIGAAVLGFFVLPKLASAAIGLPIGLVLAGLIVMFMGRRMASRTAAGSAVTMQALGFKEYLVTAEADRMKFDEAADLFSRYMPYAVVFGIAREWAGKFAQVAAAAEAAGQPLAMPVWFIPMNGDFGGFGGLGDSLDDFGTIAAGTFAATPGSSGGSAFGGGGFGGGGFSGGGGGGGGSSSW